MIRALFLVVPCRMARRGFSRGGGLPLSWLAWMLGVAGLFGAVSAGLAMIFGPSFSDSLFQGPSVRDHFLLGMVGGLVVYTAWMVYSAFLMVVLWVRGIAPDTIVASSSAATTDSVAADSMVMGRHVAPAVPMRWRRRGKDPLVPMELPAMFAFMTAGMAVTIIVGPASTYDVAVDGLKVVVPLLAASGISCLVGRHRHGLDTFTGRHSP